MIHVGVVGCGKIAEKHLNGYRKLSDIEITVTDIVDKGQMIAENYGVAWHDDPMALIASDQINAVDVCIPTPSHAEVVLKALDHGKHVFCEKPLARNLDEIEQIQAKASETDSVVMVGYLYRFHPAFQLVRDVLQEGVLGEPYFATFRVGGRGSHKAWKHKAETGGGAGNEMMVHMLDLALWYFDDASEIDNLYTDTILKQREIEGETVQVDAEDVMLLKLDMTSDVTVLCQSDLITPSYMNYLEVHGTNGSIWTSIIDHFPTIVYCKEPRGVYDRGHNFFEFDRVDLFERELGHFIQCVRDGRPTDLNSIDDSLKIMKVIESVTSQRQNGGL